MTATNGATSQAKTRMPGLDGLKAIAIIFVVMIHAAPLHSGWYERYITQGVARLAVPVFLIITGYLTGFKAKGRPALAVRFRRFLWLQLFYGAFYWAFGLRHGFPDHLTLRAALLHFWAGSYPGQYYLVILVQLFFVTAFLLPTAFWRSRISLVLSALGVVAGTVLLWSYGAPNRSPLLAILDRGQDNSIWLWLFYFTLGGYLGSRLRDGSLASWSNRWGPALASMGLAITLILVDGALHAQANHDMAFPYTRLSVLVAATLVGLAVPTLAHWRAPGELQQLGRHSFAIFVFNPAVLGIFLDLYGRASQVWSSLIYVACILLVSLGIGVVLQKRAPLLLP